MNLEDFRYPLISAISDGYYASHELENLYKLYFLFQGEVTQDNKFGKFIAWKCENKSGKSMTFWFVSENNSLFET